MHTDPHIQGTAPPKTLDAGARFWLVFDDFQIVFIYLSLVLKITKLRKIEFCDKKQLQSRQHRYGTTSLLLVA